MDKIKVLAISFFGLSQNLVQILNGWGNLLIVILTVSVLYYKVRIAKLKYKEQIISNQNTYENQ